MDHDQYRPLVAGDPAPSYQARLLDGARFSLDDLGGEPVLINVWATWCIPCRTEMPALQQLHELYGDAGLNVVGINVDAGQNDAPVLAFLDDLRITFPNARDPDNRATRVFRMVGVPETLLVGADGRIAHRWIGSFDPASPEARRHIDAVLQSPPQAMHYENFSARPIPPPARVP